MRAFRSLIVGFFTITYMTLEETFQRTPRILKLLELHVLATSCRYLVWWCGLMDIPDGEVGDAVGFQRREISWPKVICCPIFSHQWTENRFLRIEPTRYLAPKFNLGILTAHKCNVPTEKLCFAFTLLCFVETGAELCRMCWPLPHLSWAVHLNTLRTLFA